MKSVCIQSFCGPYIPLLDWIRRDTKYFSIFSPNARKCGPEKLRIPTPLAKCQLNVPQVKNWKHGINSLTFWRILRRNLLQSHLKKPNSVLHSDVKSKEKPRNLIPTLSVTVDCFISWWFCTHWKTVKRSVLYFIWLGSYQV